MPDGTIFAREKHFEPAILVCADGKAVCFPDFGRRSAQALPSAPKWSLVDLPGVPEGAVVTEAVTVHMDAYSRAEVSLASRSSRSVVETTNASNCLSLLLAA